MKIRLDQVANSCLILVSLVAGTVLVEQRLTAPARSKNHTIEALLGTRINMVMPWEQSSTNVVVALSSQCHFCVASVPFYRKLNRTAHALPKGRVALIVISPEPAAVTKQFLADQGIAADRIATVPLAVVGTTGTPTLFVVDSRGVIRSATKGKLEPSKEESFLKAINAGAA